ncbi:Uncharacterised protein [Bordetella pertussis]|nr:Uncharacterised protein [Bordetella pertussis]CFP61958.1 Uncharacterised protein [Bordetella pertussis]
MAPSGTTAATARGSSAGSRWPSSTISAEAGTDRSLPSALTTSVREPRSSPANWYSDSVSGTGVTAPRMVAGSAPSATVMGNGLPGWAWAWSRKSSAPPRCDSQRMISLFGPSGCWR